MRALLVKSHSIVSKNTGVTPPLGLMYLAAYIRTLPGVQVKIIDMKFSADPTGSLAEAIRGWKPDVLGISSLTAEATLAMRLARTARRIESALPVLIGGPHPSAFSEEVLDEPAIDAAIVGEGEKTLAAILEVIEAEGAAWRDPGVLAKIPGLAYRDQDGLAHLSPPRPPVEDLDALPYPAWDLVDLPRYWRLPSMSTIGVRPYMTLFTSRGCPYRCSYCHGIFGKQFRARSPENILGEIEELRARYGVNDLEIVDDISNLDRGRLHAILEGLLERGLHPTLNFPNGVRTDLIEEDTIRLLKRVGAGEISVAVETASPRLQELVEKRLDLDRVWRNIELLDREHILTRGFFMLGFPTETEEELRSTISFACRSRLHLALFFTVTPFEGTRLRQMYADHGKLPAGSETIDYEYYGAPFNGSDVPDWKFRWLYRSAYYRFYGDPSRIFRIARDRPYRRDIPRRVFNLVRNVASFRRLDEGGER